MAIFASTTTSGYSDPLKALSIKALEQRLKDQQAQAAAQHPDAAMMATIPGGIGSVLGIIGDKMEQGRADSALVANRDALAKVRAGMDLEHPTAQNIADLGRYDPDAAKEALQMWAENRRHDATIASQNRGQDVTARGQDVGANVATRGQDVTARGQDVGANVATRGQDVTVRGQDVGANTAAAANDVAVRGQDVGANTAIRGQDVQVRGQDVGANTAAAANDVAVRGQDVGANTAIRGQDIGANTAARGQDVQVRGQDVGANTAIRGQDVGANTAIRGQDVGANTAIRGQDVGANTAIRGQDVGASTAARGQDITARGQDMTQNTAVRGQDVQVRGQDVTARGQDIVKGTTERGQDLANRVKMDDLTKGTGIMSEYAQHAQALDRLQEAQQLVHDGINTGFWSNAQTKAAQIADGRWGTDADAAARTTRFNQIMDQHSIAQMAAQLKGQTTNFEMGEFQKINNNPNATPEQRIAAIQKLIAQATVDKNVYASAAKTAQKQIGGPTVEEIDETLSAGRKGGGAGSGGVVSGITEEEAMKLSPGTKFKLKDGRTGVAE